MKDYLGQTLYPGDYVIKGGKGNKAAEYGMILHRITKITDDLIKTERMDVKYDLVKKRPQIKLKKVSIHSGTKCAFVRPADEIKFLFDKVRDQSYNQQEADLIAKWIHGVKQVW